jgi:hypothetical protein
MSENFTNDLSIELPTVAKSAPVGFIKEEIELQGKVIDVLCVQIGELKEQINVENTK